MQQENPNVAGAEVPKLPAYANTLGFRIIQSYGLAPQQPESISQDIDEVLKKIAIIKATDVESMVVVMRTKATNGDKEGFNLVVAAVGAQSLVMGSAMMLQEHLVNDIGGPAAFTGFLGDVLMADEAKDQCREAPDTCAALAEVAAEIQEEAEEVAAEIQEDYKFVSAGDSTARH